MLQRYPNPSLIQPRSWSWTLQQGVMDRFGRIRAQQALMAMGLIAGVVVILCLYLYQASRVTVAEYAILQQQQDVARLQRENSNLLGLIAVQSSIAEMNKRAAAAGYGPAEVVRYLPTKPLTTPTLSNPAAESTAVLDTAQTPPTLLPPSLSAATGRDAAPTAGGSP